MASKPTTESDVEIHKKWAATVFGIAFIALIIAGLFFTYQLQMQKLAIGAEQIRATTALLGQPVKGEFECDGAIAGALEIGTRKENYTTKIFNPVVAVNANPLAFANYTPTMNETTRRGVKSVPDFEKLSLNDVKLHCRFSGEAPLAFMKGMEDNPRSVIGDFIN